MNPRIPIYLIIALLVSGMAASCNSDSDSSFTQQGDFGNCSVTAFSLAKDDSVLARLDSVFFSIDLTGGRIFNADSLPVGTDVSKLVVKISTSSASAVELTYHDAKTGRDSTVNYIDHPNDSINFANGPVKLMVKSYDVQKTYTYTVSVNVHKEVPDTLYWDETARTTLPSLYAEPSGQKTVQMRDITYCLTSNENHSEVCLSSTTDLYANRWESRKVAMLPAGIVVESFAATDRALYLCDGHGLLHESTDGGTTWTSTGITLTHVYGGYGDKLLGARLDEDGWKQVSYPDGAVKPLPAGAPVQGTSQLVTYESKWSATPYAVMVGGRDADNNLLGSAWGYDGSTWAKVSTRDIHEREGMALFPYATPRVNANNWSVTERGALVALGGRFESSAGIIASRTVYVSYDQGITWNQASSYMQLPEYIDGSWGCQAIVETRTLTSHSPAAAAPEGWVNFGGSTIPDWAYPAAEQLSRATRPLEEWECPYIYLFAGYNSYGAQKNELWRGVIRRFTFKPLY